MLARTLGALVLFLPVAGCILIAPDLQSFDNCPINGESPCGSCLRQHCQVEINGCCGEEECREASFSIGSDDESGTTMQALDYCASGDTSTCGNALQTARSSVAGESVKTCITNECRAECVPNTALSKWTCRAPRGQDECSACIFSKCDAQIDGCCAESSCETQLATEMSACTGGDAPGCVEMARASKTGKEGVVRACVTKSCAEECFGNGHPHQRCSLQGGGAYCTCQNAETASGDECSTDAVPKSHCFFKEQGCICGHYACDMDYSVPSAPSCACKLTYERDGTGSSAECNPSTLGSVRPGDEPVCCLALGNSYSEVSCICRPYGSCYGDESTVFSCDKSQFFSAMANLKTDRCSQ